MHFGEDCLPEALLALSVLGYLLFIPVMLIVPERTYIELEVGPHERVPVVADDWKVSV